MLLGLASQPGMIGTVFLKAQNRIQEPAKLRRLIVDLIEKEHWSSTGTDIKGDAYECFSPRARPTRALAPLATS